MFGWGKKKPSDERAVLPSDERAVLVTQAREMLAGMERNWDTPTHMTFAVLLANLWREFELAHGSPAAFAVLPDNVKSSYVADLVQRTEALNSELERLDAKRAAKSALTDVLCCWAAARLLGFYLLAVAANDREWEAELGPVLDGYMVQGYQMSWAGHPLPGDDRLDRSEQSEVQPIARFAR